MQLATAFPGAHLKAADLAAGAVTYMIAGVAMGKVGDDTKPIMTFADPQTQMPIPQDLVLNQVNWQTIADAFGDESNNWPGQVIQLYATQTQFGGKMVPCIRVQVPGQVAPVGVAPPDPVGAAVAPVGLPGQVPGQPVYAAPVAPAAPLPVGVPPPAPAAVAPPVQPVPVQPAPGVPAQVSSTVQPPQFPGGQPQMVVPPGWPPGVPYPPGS